MELPRLTLSFATGMFCMLVATFLSAASDAAPSSDQKKRLALQHQLDYNARLIDATWIGTHNSYNAERAGYPIPNQTYTMIEQLDAGFRVLSYDIYVFDGVRLCHQVCSLDDESLASALNQFADWLNENPNEVVMIIIQEGLLTSAEYALATSAFENNLGNYIYQPQDFDSSYNDGSCRNVPLRALSKQAVRDAGKQVILATYEGCDNKGEWRDWVWELPNQGYVADAYERAATLRPYNALSMIYEDRSIWGAVTQCTLEQVSDLENFFSTFLGGNYQKEAEECVDSWQLTEAEMADGLKRGAGVIGLDFGVAKNRHEGAIWSWDESQPNGGSAENCAVQKQSGRWVDSKCSNSRRVACQSVSTGQWQISQASVSFAQAQQTCAAMGDFAFSAPINALQNNQLVKTRSAISSAIWVNATDTVSEGQWQAHSAYQDNATGLVNGAVPSIDNRLYNQRFEVNHEIAQIPLGLFMSSQSGVFLSPPSNNDGAPGVLKIHKPAIGEYSPFSVLMNFAEWDYLSVKRHTEEHFDLLNMAMGMRKMEDGSIWEVGRFSLEGDTSFSHIPFTFEFEKAPYLFLTIRVDGGSDVVTIRAKDLTKSGFSAALFEQEANSDGHVKVEVNYLAIQSDATDNRQIIAGGRPINYRVYTDSLSSSWKKVGQYTYRLQEEQSKDAETSHTSETIHVLEIDNAAFVQVVSFNGADTIAIRRK